MRNRPQIHIAVQCHHFQRRFCWMMSSIAQQTRPDLVSVSVAYMPGNGVPSTESVCDLFRNELHIQRSVWNDYDQFQRRGLVRNEQLRTCSTPWIMFGDCDMVYHPNYFERLVDLLNRDHANATYMLSSGRMSNPKEDTNRLVDSQVFTDAKEVPAAFARADALPKKPMRNVGAGFSQIVHMEYGAHDGYYVTPDACRDWDWSKRGSNPKSDMQFRRRVSQAGGPRQSLPVWFSENAIHLNHNRDPEAGHHLTEQR